MQKNKTSLTSKSRSFANRSLGLLKSGAMLRFLKAPYLSRYIRLKPIAPIKTKMCLVIDRKELKLD